MSKKSGKSKENFEKSQENFSKGQKKKSGKISPLDLWQPCFYLRQNVMSIRNNLLFNVLVLCIAKVCIFVCLLYIA